ncbi:hypothetical protein L7F22_000561 [Adiantum nelumboides]|nr:hypothetical protein [Adiantum nelumboides]
MAHRSCFSSNYQQLLLRLLVAVMLLLLQPACSARVLADAPAPNTSTTSIANVVEIIVIGDSTAANYTHDPTKYPLSGWATFLPDHFLNQSSAASATVAPGPSIVAVRDLAVSGRSSKSYFDEQLWRQAQSSYLSPGDYVFIQFGHNDQEPDAPRHTEPFTTYKNYLSTYVNDTRAAMANPVLLTPISRAIWSNGTLLQTLGDYAAAMRQLAQELQVPLIDLNEATAALFAGLGEVATQNNLFMCLEPGQFPNYAGGDHDTTHLQEEGAKQVAALAAQAIANQLTGLQPYLRY